MKRRDTGSMPVDGSSGEEEGGGGWKGREGDGERGGGGWGGSRGGNDKRGEDDIVVQHMREQREIANTRAHLKVLQTKEMHNHHMFLPNLGPLQFQK